MCGTSFALALGAVGGEGGAHDMRDDKAVPDLQTAAHEESSNRYRALQLRKARLAGIALHVIAHESSDSCAVRPK